MLEKLDQIIDSVHCAYNLTAFDIDKCLKAVQVKNLNEARAALRDAQAELGALRREARGCGLDRYDAMRAAGIHVTEEQREAARWPISAEGPPTYPVCDWCGLRFKPTSFDRATCCCRPQTVQQCEAMSLIQCQTCYEVNDRDCVGYEDRMQEAREASRAE